MASWWIGLSCAGGFRAFLPPTESSSLSAQSTMSPDLLTPMSHMASDTSDSQGSVQSRPGPFRKTLTVAQAPVRFRLSLGPSVKVRFSIN